MATMKAARIHEYGGPEVLQIESIARPEPSAGEILIQVKACSVNPIDWKFRAGYGRGWMSHQLPLTLGAEIAGVVAGLGADVTGYNIGDEIYAYPSLARCGGYAEYATVLPSETALKPQTLDFVEAAALPVGVLTAWQAYDMGGLQAGQKVLIHAAAGGVGSLAVQVAKLRGAHVIGTASARNADFLRELGADETIDYRTTDFAQALHDVDMVFDLIGGATLEKSYGVVKSGGTIISAVQPPDAQTAERYGVNAAMVQVKPDTAQLQELAGWADAGRIKPIVATVLPLAEIQQAHKFSEAGRSRGKIVIAL